MIGNMLSYFSNNQRAIDPTELNDQFHRKTPLLLDNENVVMAFKAGRDLTLFTSLRIMIVDVQGLSGKRVSYRSIPYSSIRSFEVESAGSWDRDSELDIYTANLWNMEKIEMDFRKGQVDILSIHRLLSAVILGDSSEAAEYLVGDGSKLQIKSSGGMGNFINWLGSNSVEQDASIIDAQLHSDPPLLLASESVEKAYKSGRDLFIYTTHRVLLIDVKGLRGKKVEYLTLPLKWIHGFEVETAGFMDRDAEVYLKNDIPGKSKIQQDILVSKGDVMELQQYLTEKLVI